MHMYVCVQWGERRGMNRIQAASLRPEWLARAQFTLGLVSLILLSPTARMQRQHTVTGGHLGAKREPCGGKPEP